MWNKWNHFRIVIAMTLKLLNILFITQVSAYKSHNSSKLWINIDIYFKYRRILRLDKENNLPMNFICIIISKINVFLYCDYSKLYQEVK